MSSSRGSLIYRIWATIKQGAFHGDHRARKTTVEETQYARQSSMKKSSQVSQLGGATTSGKALDLGRGEPWEKAAHKLGLLPFPAVSLKSTEEAPAKAYSPSFAEVDTNMQPVREKKSAMFEVDARGRHYINPQPVLMPEWRSEPPGAFEKQLEDNQSTIHTAEPEGGKTKKTPIVRKKTSAAKKKAGADRSMDESSKPKQRKPRAKKTSVNVQPEEEVLAFSSESALVIDSATLVVQQLMGEYKDWDHWVHAWDTEVGEIDVKKESPVGHGRISYFGIYCGLSGNFGDGKSYLWVDVLDGGKADVLKVFKPYFEDPCVKKVWHNYSFDKHILSRHGIHAQGFLRADIMFLALAQLSDLARRGAKGG